jgi:hypothetical protein
MFMKDDISGDKKKLLKRDVIQPITFETKKIIKENTSMSSGIKFGSISS